MADAVSVKSPHTITIDNRNKIVITGIEEVTSYDSDTIIATSEAGELIVQGKKLHISNFDRISGKLSGDGTIDAVQYVDIKPKNESVFSRIFK